MLTIKKDLDFSDFEDLFSWELNYYSYEAKRIIYDALVDRDEDFSEEDISDYIRYQINVMSVDEVISDYDYMMEEDELNQAKEDDEIAEYVENFLNDYTTILGSFVEDGETFLVFEEF